MTGLSLLLLLLVRLVSLLLVLLLSWVMMIAENAILRRMRAVLVS
jgi:hypothetical protein